MTPECQRVRLPWAWLALPLAGWGVLVLIGYWPTRVCGESRGIAAMLTAQVLVVATVYVTLIPAMVKMAGTDAPGRLNAGLKAATLRFLFTLGLMGLVLWRGDVERPIFLVWVAIAYVVMIKCETLVLVRWARLLERASCS